MKILGIESSCDETAAAVIEAKNNDKKVTLLSNVVASSLEIHAKTGGIIPENAAREQVKYMIPVIMKALEDSNLYPLSSIRQLTDYLLSSTIYRPNIDAIAVTVGPGLIGSLLVGVETAKTLSYVWQKPIIPVNHLIGHVYANFIEVEKHFASLSLRATERSVAIPSDKRLLRLPASRDPRNDKITFPALALIVSGGHTDLVLMRNHGKIKWLGGTRDDAAGEAFDKIGRLLGLPYPGGPAIENAAQNGNPKAYQFPRPMIDSNDFDFSFSGLKTAVLRSLYSTIESVHPLPFPLPSRERVRLRGQVQTIKKLSDKEIGNLSASVQQAIIDVLISKTLKAAQKYKVKSILLGGGVAANQKLRDELILNTKYLIPNTAIYVPQKSLCTDNAAMIAAAAFFNYEEVPWQEVKADPELYFN